MPSLKEGRAPKSRSSPRAGTGKASNARADRPRVAEVEDNGVPVAARARVSEIQQARMVAAMVEIASERGLADATVARVVARAGVSRRTFYELFEDREDCFLAAFDEGVAQASRYVLDAYDPNAKWVRRIRAALIALLSSLDAERGLGDLLIVESLGAGPRAIERRRRVLAGITAEVESGRHEGKAANEPPPLTAEGIVGGVLSVIHARMAARVPAAGGEPRGAEDERPLVELTNPLMAMIVLPYLGPVAARNELGRSAPKPHTPAVNWGGDPLRDLGMRLTYRTVRVLLSIAAAPGSSNREIGQAAGIADQGQISKLLRRLEGLGLVRNAGLAPRKGAPNAWTLTEKGVEVQRAMSGEGAGAERAVNGRLASKRSERGTRGTR
jgi:AcrR family transcriptional regulator